MPAAASFKPRFDGLLVLFSSPTARMAAGLAAQDSDPGCPIVRKQRLQQRRAEVTRGHQWARPGRLSGWVCAGPEPQHHRGRERGGEMASAGPECRNQPGGFPALIALRRRPQQVRPMPRKRRDPANPEPDPKPKPARRPPQAIGEPLGDVWPDLWDFIRRAFDPDPEPPWPPRKPQRRR